MAVQQAYYLPFDSLGRIIGPPLGGWLFSITIGLPYISGILLSLIAFVLYKFYMGRSKSFQPIN